MIVQDLQFSHDVFFRQRRRDTSPTPHNRQEVQVSNAYGHIRCCCRVFALPSFAWIDIRIRWYNVDCYNRAFHLLRYTDCHGFDMA